MKKNKYNPFGGIIADISNSNISGLRRPISERAQRYDYGARQYDCTAPHFTTPDPLAEKYYGWNMYGYCKNNPINRVDPDGMDDIYSRNGKFLYTDKKETDHIMIRTAQISFEFPGQKFNVDFTTPIENIELKAEAYSNIFTNVVSGMDEVDVSKLHNGKISVTDWNEDSGNGFASTNYFNDSDFTGMALATTNKDHTDALITAYVYKIGLEAPIFTTRSNIQNTLGAHEYQGHFIKDWSGADHHKAYEYQMSHPSWPKTTEHYKKYH